MAPSDWPAVSREKQEWTPAPQWGVRATEYPHPETYEAAVPPQIADLLPTPSTEVAGKAAAAAHELGRFDAEAGSRVASFAPVLLRSEAASSSQIENLTASARAIFSAELGAKGGRNAELIAANTRAMTTAIELSEQLDPESVLEMHRVLMEGQDIHTPGAWRTEPVWIDTRSDSPIGAEFIAPSHHRVPGLVEDLAAFARRTDLPVLTAVAIAHAQFETIHPFTDGNGRTGRAFAQAMLRHRRLTRNVAVPVSAGLLADVDGYHAALMAYRRGDIDPIVIAFADASLRAVENSRQLLAELDRIRDGWEERLKARSDSNAWRLLDVFLRRPVLDAASAAGELGIRTPNVYPPLRKLTETGILKSKREHRLGPFWRSDEVLAAIDSFAVRAGRRRVN